MAHGKIAFYQPTGVCEFCVDLLYPAGLGEVRYALGPIDVPHYNLYAAAKMNGEPAPGYSSGQAIQAGCRGQGVVAGVGEIETGREVRGRGGVVSGVERQRAEELMRGRGAARVPQCRERPLRLARTRWTSTCCSPSERAPRR